MLEIKCRFHEVVTLGCAEVCNEKEVDIFRRHVATLNVITVDFSSQVPTAAMLLLLMIKTESI
jgi:hypothetical protein